MNTVPYTPDAPTVATALDNPDDYEIRFSAFNGHVLVNKFNDCAEKILSDEDVAKILAAWKPLRAAYELEQEVFDNTDTEFADPVRAVVMHLVFTSESPVKAVLRLREYSKARPGMFRIHGYNLVGCVDGTSQIGLADAKNLIEFARLAAGITKEAK